MCGNNCNNNFPHLYHGPRTRARSLVVEVFLTLMVKGRKALNEIHRNIFYKRLYLDANKTCVLVVRLYTNHFSLDILLVL